MVVAPATKYKTYLYQKLAVANVGAPIIHFVFREYQSEVEMRRVVSELDAPTVTSTLTAKYGIRGRLHEWE
jgi:hypothetical protein